MVNIYQFFFEFFSCKQRVQLLQLIDCVQTLWQYVIQQHSVING